MSPILENAPEGRGLIPRHAAIAAAALGFAALSGLALGSLPTVNKGMARAAPETVSKTAPAVASNQTTMEEEARQAAVRQLAQSMLKKALAEQASAAKSAAPPQGNIAMTTTGANASAALADKADTVATTQTSSALRSGAQGSNAPVAAIPTPPATEQTASLDPADMERLAGKAAEAIRNGDIASARLVLEHAARAGDATAIYALAETYDPRVLVKLRVHGMQGEPDTARNLYQRALDNGVEEARSRL